MKRDFLYEFLFLSLFVFLFFFLEMRFSIEFLYLELGMLRSYLRQFNLQQIPINSLRNTNASRPIINSLPLSNLVSTSQLRVYLAVEHELVVRLCAIPSQGQAHRRMTSFPHGCSGLSRSQKFP